MCYLKLPASLIRSEHKENARQQKIPRAIATWLQLESQVSNAQRAILWRRIGKPYTVST